MGSDIYTIWQFFNSGALSTPCPELPRDIVLRDAATNADLATIGAVPSFPFAITNLAAPLFAADTPKFITAPQPDQYCVYPVNTILPITQRALGHATYFGATTHLASVAIFPFPTGVLFGNDGFTYSRTAEGSAWYFVGDVATARKFFAAVTEIARTMAAHWSPDTDSLPTPSATSDDDAKDIALQRNVLNDALQELFGWLSAGVERDVTLREQLETMIAYVPPTAAYAGAALSYHGNTDGWFTSSADHIAVHRDLRGYVRRNEYGLLASMFEHEVTHRTLSEHFCELLPRTGTAVCAQPFEEIIFAGVNIFRTTHTELLERDHVAHLQSTLFGTAQPLEEALAYAAQQQYAENFPPDMQAQIRLYEPSRQRMVRSMLSRPLPLAAFELSRAYYDEGLRAVLRADTAAATAYLTEYDHLLHCAAGISRECPDIPWK